MFSITNSTPRNTESKSDIEQDDDSFKLCAIYIKKAMFTQEGTGTHSGTLVTSMNILKRKYIYVLRTPIIYVCIHILSNTVYPLIYIAQCSTAFVPFGPVNEIVAVIVHRRTREIFKSVVIFSFMIV